MLPSHSQFTLESEHLAIWNRLTGRTPPFEGVYLGSNPSSRISIPTIRNFEKMKVESTKLMKEILQDPEARKQLQAALVNLSLTVDFKGKTYTLESMS